jgi:putative FmdB family regulatory protein
MPKYDFSCPNCGGIEIEHSIHAPHPAACPVCGAEIQRDMSSAKMPLTVYYGLGWTGARQPTSRIKREPTSEEADVPYA